MTSGSASATSDDKLWAALAYVFTPLLPIVISLMEDKKNRPYIKQHNMQALVWGIAAILISFLLGATIILACVAWVVYLPQLYWGYQAYQGKAVTIPVITNLVKQQGWA
jgi:uncharacterized membrane protein